MVEPLGRQAGPLADKPAAQRVLRIALDADDLAVLNGHQDAAHVAAELAVCLLDDLFAHMDRLQGHMYQFRGGLEMRLRLERNVLRGGAE